MLAMLEYYFGGQQLKTCSESKGISQVLLLRPVYFELICKIMICYVVKIHSFRVLTWHLSQMPPTRVRSNGNTFPKPYSHLYLGQTVKCYTVAAGY